MWNNFVTLSDEEIFNNTFSISSLFEILKDGRVLRHPNVNATFSNTRVAIAIDNSLILFEKETFSNCKFLNFESDVDCLKVSSNGAIVTCALSNGTIHGIHIKGIPLFTVEIDANHVSPNGGATFTDIYEHNSEYYLMCKNGQIYRLSNIDSEQLSNTVLGDVNGTLNETLCNPLLETIPSTKYNFDVCYFGLSSYEGNLMFVYSRANYIYMKDSVMEQKVPIPSDFGDIVNISTCDDLILVQSNKGTLFEICQYTGTIFPRPIPADNFIQNLNLMENNAGDIELLMLIESKLTTELLLKIFEFPSMNCKFNIPMPKHTWIINQPKSSANIYYLCGTLDKSTDLITSVKMRMISETQPENRLKTLIEKGLLDEAHEFAIKFNLSLQPIYEARAKRILLEIGLIDQSNLEAVAARFDDLLKISKLITNTEFLLQMRNMEISDRKVMKKFLQFLVKHVKFDNYPKDYAEITEQLLRLETLNMIDMYECDLHWRKFVYHTNLIKYCVKFLETDISIACLILKQHASSILPHLKDSNILKTLHTISPKTEPFGVIQWMRHYLPIVSRTYPQALPILNDWAISKTTSFQLLKEWPEIGLEFGTNMINIFESIEYLFPDTQRQYDMCISKFRRVINTLEELSVLKTRFNLTLTFDDYMNESIEESAFRILQRINVKNLENLVNEFLLAIFNEKGIDLAPTLVRYIEYLVRNRKSIHIWQERSVACTMLIRNEEIKLKCAITILKSASVPWLKVLDPILKFRLSSHPLANDILTEYQMQKIKIMKLKYGWDPDSLKSKNNMKFVFRIVKMNQTDLIKDVKEFVEFDPTIKNSAFFYCVHELARLGNVDQSIQMLESLNEDDFRDCCNQISKITTKLIEDEMDNCEAFDNLMELLKYVMVKNVDSQYKCIIKNLLSVQMLRNEFGLNVTLSSLSSSVKSETFLDYSINSLIEMLKNQENGFIKQAWLSIAKLSDTLNVDVIFVALKLLKKVNNTRFSCAITKLILEFNTVTADNANLYVILAMILIVQQAGSVEGPLCDNYAVGMSYPLAYQLLIYAEKYGADDVRDLLNFTRIGNDAFSLDKIQQYLDAELESEENLIALAFVNLVDDKSLVKSNRRDSMSVFEEVNQVNRAPMNEQKSDSVIKCLSHVLQTLVMDLKPNTTFYNRLAKIFTIKEETSRTVLFTSLEQLIKVKLYTSAFVIIQFIQNQQKYSAKILMSSDLVQMLLRKILKSALHQKEPNFDQILPILRADTAPDECLHFLKKELKTGLVKINCLTLLEKYGELTDDSNRIKSERECRLKYFYYMQLCQMDPSLKTDTNFDIISYEQLFSDLNNKIVDVQLLEKICKDFHWNFEKVLVCQIITILQIQELDFDTEIDVMGKEQIVIKVSADKIRSLCQPYIDQLADTKLLAAKLYEFIATINSYFYELYLCVIEILTQNNLLPKDMELWSHILLFLKHKMVTKRSKRIGQIETDWWLKIQNDTGVMPKIARYRFPFQMLITQPLKDILDEEVCVENCDQWFPLVKLHSNMKGVVSMEEIYQEQDYFCMSAIKNSITDYKPNNDSGAEVWNLQPVNNAFLQAVLHLVEHMKDIHRILFVLYFVFNHAPEGADQVEAAYECFKFAIIHEDELRESNRGYDIVVKIKRKYPMFKTQHLLHLYGLNEDNLSQLVESPLQLISALYCHESVFKSDSKIDFNQVAQEIAELNQLDFHNIQMVLLNNWLSFSSQESNDTLEATFYNDLDVTISNNDSEFQINNNSVERAYYILRSWEQKSAFEFLVSHIIPPDDESSLNTGRQLQVFDCLIKLVNDDTESSLLDLVSTPHYIALKCIHYLKPFGFKFTIEKFQNYDKLRILKQIWSTNASNPKALDVITFICVGYDIYEPIIWNNLLKQMVNLHMTKELLAIIDSIATKPSLVHLDGLVIAWEYLIRMPFKNINRMRSYEQDELMCKSLFMLQSCPVKSKMNLIDLAEICIRFNQIHVACVLFAFFNDGTGEQLKEQLKTNYNTESLKNDITNLEEFGIYHFVTKLAIKKLNL